MAYKATARPGWATPALLVLPLGFEPKLLGFPDLYLEGFALSYLESLASLTGLDEGSIELPRRDSNSRFKLSPLDYSSEAYVPVQGLASLSN